MAKPFLPDELWNRIEPLLPAETPKPKGGRPPVPNRAAQRVKNGAMKNGAMHLLMKRV